MLPARIAAAMTQREPDGVVIIARHPVDPCLRIHDQAYLHRIEQQLRASEDAADPLRSDRWNRRRIMARAEFGDLAKDGSLLLPSVLRRQGNIRDRVLLVCTGDTIEIWDPDIARESGEPFLIDLAERVPPEGA
jgi:DNA-binding transcriptional regulator/RsmH inhibitor MraZ